MNYHTKQTLKEHAKRFSGVSQAIILAGGTSLVKDLRIYGEYVGDWNCNHISIAVNHHANILFTDYAVVEDMPIIHLMRDAPDTMVMGRYSQADIDISEAPNWNNGGMNAVWIADYIGFKEIILCGFDCFKEAQRYYWHDPIFALSQFDRDVHDEVMDVWREVKENLRFPERVKSMSGPLTEVFGEWSLNKQK